MRAVYLADLDAFVRLLDLPGTEPPNVFLHGLGRSSLTLAHVAVEGALGESRSLLVDLLGHGLSDAPEDFAYTLDAHADVVVRVLDELGVARYRLIGHSLGGAVAVLAAARAPERVAALVVAEGNLDPGGAAMSSAIARRPEDEYVRDGYEQTLVEMRDEARANPASIYASTVAVQRLASPRALHRSARSLIESTRPTVREQLLGLDLPRAFIVGERTYEATERPPSGEAGDGLEGTPVRLLVVPDAGHPMMFQNPRGFARAIAAAIDGTR